MDIREEQRARLLAGWLLEFGIRVGDIDLGAHQHCVCPLHNELRTIAAEERQEEARRAALKSGNDLEFVRLLRERLEKEAESGGKLNVLGLNVATVRLISALESGWGPYPDVDDSTLAEEHLLPAYGELREAVLGFLKEAFND
jgi:hypothetical protein